MKRNISQINLQIKKLKILQIKVENELSTDKLAKL